MSLPRVARELDALGEANRTWVYRTYSEERRAMGSAVILSASPLVGHKASGMTFILASEIPECCSSRERIRGGATGDGWCRVRLGQRTRVALGSRATFVVVDKHEGRLPPEIGCVQLGHTSRCSCRYRTPGASERGRPLRVGCRGR